jgi:pyrimidine-specific ribonucleoside hydrolase
MLAEYSWRNNLMAGGVSSTEATSLVTFSEGFPLDVTLYVPEIQALLNRGIIEKYGREEFENIILTHEFHGHIGVYSLIGTKMGLFARELMGASKKNMTVFSECGHGRLPIRCMNDGLIISTGCSPHFGKMMIDDTKDLYGALFSFNEKCLRLRLKGSYREKLESDIETLISKYKISRVLAKPYWDGIRKLAWKTWEEWDRRVVFDVAWISKETLSNSDKPTR